MFFQRTSSDTATDIPITLPDQTQGADFSSSIGYDEGSTWAGTVHAGLGNGLFATVHAPVGTPVAICKSLHNQLSLSIN